MKKSINLTKILVFVLIIALSSVILAGCINDDDKGDVKEILVVAPDGAPAMALSKLLSEKPEFENYKVTYEIIQGTTNLPQKVLASDIALAPSVFGANLYNKGEDIRMVGANVYGLLYVLGNESLTSLAQLKGKVVYSLGEGNTPEFIFKYVLSQAGIAYQNSDVVIDDQTVSIKYETESTTIIQRMAAGQAEFVVLGEPQATMAKSKNPSFEVLFDLQELYGGGYPQVATFVKGDIADNHKEFLSSFIAELTATNEWVEENPDKVQAALTANGSNLTGLTAAVISRCNINFTEMSSSLIGTVEYLTVVKSFNNKLIGGKIPNEKFFHSA